MLFLDSNSPVPLFKQLYNQLRENILSGSLPADSRLPSVRDMANNLAISRNTVDGAYQELFAEGYIYSKPRSGYYVSPLDHDAVPRPVVTKPDHSSPPRKGTTAYRYDFHPARLDPESFPKRLWRRLFLECLGENPQQLAAYCDPQGEQRLRFAIQTYLEHSRGVTCTPEQIIITSGLQNSLDIVANILKDTHTSVAVENPGYPLASSVFSHHSYTIVPIPVRADGLDIDALRTSNSSIVYVTPSHQLPLGHVIPVANRLNLIEWAEAGGNFILEDDYDSELRYSSKPIPSLQGLSPQGNIVYLGTFSKVLSPALRISYLVLPRSLLTRYHQLFRNHFSSVSQLEQRTLAKFMEQGHWDRHIRRMRNIYKKKHETILEAIHAEFGSQALVIGQGAGLHIVLQLPNVTRSEPEIIKRADQKGMRLLPFSLTFAAEKTLPVKLILGFGGMTQSELKEGVAILAQACR